MKTLHTIIQSAGKDRDYEKIVRLFHDTYENLAPKFGYETREDTKEFDPNSKNGKLMLCVVKVIIPFIVEPEVKKAIHQSFESIGVEESPREALELKIPIGDWHKGRNQALKEIETKKKNFLGE